MCGHRLLHRCERFSIDFLRDFRLIFGPKIGLILVLFGLLWACFGLILVVFRTDLFSVSTHSIRGVYGDRRGRR